MKTFFSIFAPKQITFGASPGVMAGVSWSDAVNLKAVKIWCFVQPQIPRAPSQHGVGVKIQDLIEDFHKKISLHAPPVYKYRLLPLHESLSTR